MAKSLSFVAILILVSLFSYAGLGPNNPPPQVRLGWSPSPSTGITNYTVYWGGASGNYTNSLSAGTNLTATVTNLLRGATYWFAGTATDSTGLESPFSNEVSATVPKNPGPPVGLTVTGVQ